jgi:heptosyltransferase-3
VSERILVVRPDRLGDVILSTPVLQALRERHPSAYIVFLVRKGLGELWSSGGRVDRVWEWEPGSLVESVRQMYAQRFDRVVHLQVHPELAWASFFARIPKRVGPLSKIYSWLVLNAGVRQHRSRSDRNEAQYGLELAGVGDFASARCWVDLRAQDLERIRERLRAQGVEQKFLVIHPGMGGSALNWSADRYAELAHVLECQGVCVVWSFGPQDAEMRAKIGTRAKLIWEGSAHARELAAFLAQARLVVAPSTGPLHLASAVGTRVVGVYSPLRAHHPRRWGVWGRTAQDSEMCAPCVSEAQALEQGLDAVLPLGAVLSAVLRLY